MTRTLTRFASFPSRLRPGLGLAVVAMVAAIIAYHYSLLSLANGIALQTPLGYLGLVPIIAAILAWLQIRRAPTLRPMHELPLDYALGRTVGVVLVLLAVGIALLVPVSIRFWIYRLDLVSFPVFVAGIVTLFFGLRRLWSLRYAIAFLFLAWPAPYLPLLGDWIRGFTDLTVGVLAAIAAVVPIAVPGEEGIFTLTHAGQSFVVSVGSACSGINGLVGFGLVGGALAYVVEGPMRKRFLWLAAGLALIWLLNVVRIELIFVAGTLAGRDVALNVLHPIAGLLVFNLGVAAMLLAVPRFGLAIVRLTPSTREEPSVVPSSVRRADAAFLVATVATALLLGVVNSSYAQYEPLVGSFGNPRLGAISARELSLPDWGTDFVGTYDQGQQFFGRASTWERTLFASTSTARLQSSSPIYVDVVTTPDANALNAYGLEACYRFHGYLIEDVHDVDLPGSVRAQVIDYHNPKRGADWSAVWWEWPYQQDSQTWYARIVVFIEDGPRATYIGAAGSTPAAGPFDHTNTFLTAFASQLVSRQLAGPAAPGGS